MTPPAGRGPSNSPTVPPLLALSLRDFATNGIGLRRDPLFFTRDDKLPCREFWEEAFDLAIARVARATTTREDIASGTFGGGTGAVEIASVLTIKRTGRVDLDTLQTRRWYDAPLRLRRRWGCVSAEYNNEHAEY